MDMNMDKLNARMEYLSILTEEDIADDQMPLQEESRIVLYKFIDLITLPHPTTAMTQDGKLYAKWYTDNGLFSMVFYSDTKIKVVYKDESWQQYDFYTIKDLVRFVEDIKNKHTIYSSKAEINENS